MFTYLKIGGMVVILLAAGGAGWRFASWDYGAKLARAEAQYTLNLKAVSDAATAAAQAALAKQQAMEAQIAAQDAQHTQEMSDANAQIAAAQSQLASRPDSFSVLATCPDNSAGGGSLPSAPVAPSHVDGPRQVRAVVDPGSVKRLLDAAARGDKAIVQLAALQDYVRTIISQLGAHHDPAH